MNPCQKFPLSLQANVVDLRYFKLGILLDKIVKVWIIKSYTIQLQRHLIKKLSLWHKHSSFVKKKTKKVLKSNENVKNECSSNFLYNKCIYKNIQYYKVSHYKMKFDQKFWILFVHKSLQGSNKTVKTCFLYSLISQLLAWPANRYLNGL